MIFCGNENYFQYDTTRRRAFKEKSRELAIPLGLMYAQPIKLVSAKHDDMIPRIPVVERTDSAKLFSGLHTHTVASTHTSSMK